MELNDKQIRFCDEYLVDFNATQAAIRAGYSKNSAKEIGSENLTKPNIQIYLQERKKEFAKKFEAKFSVSKERLLKELCGIALNDIRAYYDQNGALKQITALDDDSAAALASVKVDELWEGYGEERKQTGVTKEVKRWDKVKAIEVINKMLGYNEAEKVKTDGKLQIEIVRRKANTGNAE